MNARAVIIRRAEHSATLDSSFGINAHRSRLLPRLRARYGLHYTPEGKELRRLLRAGSLMEEHAPPARCRDARSF